MATPRPVRLANQNSTGSRKGAKIAKFFFAFLASWREILLPGVRESHQLGVLGVVNRYRPRGFTLADCRLLKAIGSQKDVLHSYLTCDKIGPATLAYDHPCLQVKEGEIRE